MDILITILIATLVLGFLVFIHEGGHFLAARAFGVRVSEFMIGLPGPSIGFTWRGTRFGVTAVPLGGYAAVCGMGTGEESPHLKEVLGFMYDRGTAEMEDVAEALGITDDEAYQALEELCEWGSLKRPTRRDKLNTYRTPAMAAHTEAGQKFPARELGKPDPIEDLDAFFAAERKQQYRTLPFWKRVTILLAGPFMNLLFAMIVFVIIYSCVGVDLQMQSGEVVHYVLPPLDAIVAGFKYIGMVAVAILGLFNPATAADTVSNSTSIIGIAVLSKTAFEAGFLSLLSFSAVISVSLGLANMLPIPPLDGGRFVVEIYQKIRRRNISIRALNYLSVAGMCLFFAFFIFMANQDIQRFVFGNWG
jgi:regulator of sigma E protease